MLCCDYSWNMQTFSSPLLRGKRAVAYHCHRTGTGISHQAADCWAPPGCAGGLSVAKLTQRAWEESGEGSLPWKQKGRRRKVCVSHTPYCCGRARHTSVINRSFKSLSCRAGARVANYLIWWCWAPWLAFVTCCREARWYSRAGFYQCSPKRKCAVKLSRGTCSLEPGALLRVAEGALLVLRLQSRYNQETVKHMVCVTHGLISLQYLCVRFAEWGQTKVHDLLTQAWVSRSLTRDIFSG